MLRPVRITIPKFDAGSWGNTCKRRRRKLEQLVALKGVLRWKWKWGFCQFKAAGKDLALLFLP